MALNVSIINYCLGGMPSNFLKTAQLNMIEKDEQRVSQGAQPKSWSTENAANRLQDLGKVCYLII